MNVYNLKNLTDKQLLELERAIPKERQRRLDQRTKERSKWMTKTLHYKLPHLDRNVIVLGGETGKYEPMAYPRPTINGQFVELFNTMTNVTLRCFRCQYENDSGPDGKWAVHMYAFVPRDDMIPFQLGFWEKPLDASQMTPNQYAENKYIEENPWMDEFVSSPTHIFQLMSY